MYVYEEINPAELSMTRTTGSDGGLKYYDIIHEYLHMLLDVINAALEKVHRENPLTGSFRLVEEGYSENGEAGKLYYLDFHIEASTVYGESASRGMRFEIDAAKGRECAIGARCYDPNKGVTTIHKRGKSALFHGYSIGPSSTTPKKVNLVTGSGPYRITGNVSLLVTETSLFIYSQRERYPRNILSYMLFRNVLDENAFLYVANGWRCDGTDIHTSTAPDNYFNQNFSAVAPKMWLRELYLMQMDSKDIRWFCPGVYLTKESRMLHTTEALARYINPSTSLQDENMVYLSFINTFLTDRRYILAVL